MNAVQIWFLQICLSLATVCHLQRDAQGRRQAQKKASEPLLAQQHGGWNSKQLPTDCCLLFLFSALWLDSMIFWRGRWWISISGAFVWKGASPAYVVTYDYVFSRAAHADRLVLSGQEKNPIWSITKNGVDKLSLRPDLRNPFACCLKTASTTRYWTLLWI